MHSFAVNGRPYLIMANEGDARDYAGYVEEVRLSNAGYTLDPTVFPNWAQLKTNAALGRLTVSRATGDLDDDGDYDRLDVFGARSVSIRDHQGRLVWDSADMFERLSEAFDGTLTLFNTTNSANSREAGCGQLIHPNSIQSTRPSPKHPGSRHYLRVSGGGGFDPPYFFATQEVVCRCGDRGGDPP